MEEAVLKATYRDWTSLSRNISSMATDASAPTPAPTPASAPRLFIAPVAPKTNAAADPTLSSMVNKIIRNVELHCREQELRAQDFPWQRLPVQELPVQQLAVQEMPVQAMPLQEMPVQETPAQELPQQAIPTPVEEELPNLEVPIVNSQVICEPSFLAPACSVEELTISLEEEDEVDEEETGLLVEKPEMTMEPASIPPAPEAQPKKPTPWLAHAWLWFCNQMQSRQSKKRLRVCETVSLGEKRFVAVIQVDGEQFLVGGAAGSVATLARLEPAEDFPEMLKRRWTQDSVQA